MSTSKRTPTLSKAKVEKLAYEHAKRSMKSSIALARSLGMSEQEVATFTREFNKRLTK